MCEISRQCSPLPSGGLTVGVGLSRLRNRVPAGDPFFIFDAYGTNKLHWKDLHARWLYTALTRASKQLIIVGG